MAAGDHLDVAVIGAGFGGIAAAYRLREAGFTDIAVLERAAEVGGVWRANTYPGCACDVPAALYSLSFAPNPAWSRKYAAQAEILRYQRDAVDRLGLRPLIRFDCDVRSCAWDDESRLWRLQTSQGVLTARVVVAAIGGLTVPSVPAVPGLSAFPGAVVHTADWGGADLAGQRVAVVGTGASAVQVVPQLQRIAASLVVFQRTPPWVLPRRDHGYPAGAQRLFTAVPVAQRALRLATYLALESRAVAFVRDPALMRVAEREALRFLRREVADADLRRRLTPAYRLGCKRTLLSDDWYRSLTAGNVTVVSAALREVNGRVLTGADGSEHEVDAVVLATGFHVLDNPAWNVIVGRAGRTLAETFGASPRAYKGTAVPGFPNLFLITGPNTGLGHSSMIYMIESQAAYLVSALQGMRDHGVHDVEVRPEAVQRWNDDLDRRLARTVWASGGCTSYYNDSTGRPGVVWPGTTFGFRAATRRFDPGAYLLRRA